MNTNDTKVIQKFKAGYSRLLGVQMDTFDRVGFIFVETSMRDQPEWANWIIPVWLFTYGSSRICSVSPLYASQAKIAFRNLPTSSLLTEEILAAVRTVIDDREIVENEWVQCEVLAYLQQHIKVPKSSPAVFPLQPIDDQTRVLYQSFDGGLYGIRASNGDVVAYAGIKDKGVIEEIAVWTDEDYRGQGLGKAVVAVAVDAILERGHVPVYWPDSQQNAASYRLAYSIGFQKCAEMCFCCYEVPR